MKFLLDAQLPRRLATWLNAQGHDALHTLDLPQANRTPDREIVSQADAESRVVVTKDADFVTTFQLRREPNRLLLISTGNISNEGLLKLWSEHLPEIVRALTTSRFVELDAFSLTVHD